MIKINFAERMVSINTTLSFDQMAQMEDLLQTAAMESVEAGDAVKTTLVCDLGEHMGIDIDIEPIEPAVLGNLMAGQDSDVIDTEAA